MRSDADMCVSSCELIALRARESSGGVNVSEVHAFEENPQDSVCAKAELPKRTVVAPDFLIRSLSSSEREFSSVMRTVAAELRAEKSS
ncbi:Uncharacterised protein [Chlamydia trachomatis]|nr:Uncharacterised protein [Chlamydia trachomatis]